MRRNLKVILVFALLALTISCANSPYNRAGSSYYTVSDYNQE